MSQSCKSRGMLTLQFVVPYFYLQNWYLFKSLNKRFPPLFHLSSIGIQEDASISQKFPCCLTEKIFFLFLFLFLLILIFYLIVMWRTNSIIHSCVHIFFFNSLFICFSKTSTSLPIQWVSWGMQRRYTISNIRCSQICWFARTTWPQSYIYWEIWKFPRTIFKSRGNKRMAWGPLRCCLLFLEYCLFKY